MHQVRSEVVWILTALLLCVVPASYASETVSDSDSKWSRSRVTIAVSTSLLTAPNIEGDAFGAVLAAIQAWSAAADIRIEFVETDEQNVSPKGIRGDGISLLTAAPTADNLKLFPGQSESAAAATRIFTDSSRNIVEADIVLNPFLRFSTDGSYGTFDLQATITHEIGHLLGLDHSPVWGSVMYEKAAPSFGQARAVSGKRALPEVDAASLRGLYGPKPNDLTCCGMITGRISGIPRQARPKIAVWLEEIVSGRLVAAAAVSSSFAYEIAGVPEGSYRIRVAAETDSLGVASSGDLLDLQVADVVRKNFKVVPAPTSLPDAFLGSTPQIARLPATFTALAPRSLFVGGALKNDSIDEIRISGTEIAFGRDDIRFADYGNSVKLIALEFPGEPALAPGLYSVEITDHKGVTRFLLGALVVSSN